MSIKVQIQRKLDSFLLDISFQSECRRIGILGASGCGKSMTLKSIAGIETPDQGHIEAEGRTLFDRADRINLKPQKRNVGYLFQNYALFPTMTVEKNIAAGLKGSRQENEVRVREMVKKFQLQGLVYAGRTLGMSDTKIFWKIIVPTAGPGIASGTILTFARALGEYGATSMLAGNIPGKTGTISQKIAMVIQDGDYLTAGIWVAVVMVIVFVVIFLMNLISGKKMKNIGRW